jgi:V/A-type H+-transporting ATPase subunit A
MFLERAGRVQPLGRDRAPGAVTIVSAISPPGGDFSEPVTQAALRAAGALWALDPALAHQRHFPAVDWETSYSLYAGAMAPWFARQGGPRWASLRAEVATLLQRDRELREIAGLIGSSALADSDRLLIEAAERLRATVLRQSAYDPKDFSSTPNQTYELVKKCLDDYHAAAP